MSFAEEIVEGNLKRSVFTVFEDIFSAISGFWASFAQEIVEKILKIDVFTVCVYLFSAISGFGASFAEEIVEENLKNDVLPFLKIFLGCFLCKMSCKTRNSRGNSAKNT